MICEVEDAWRLENENEVDVLAIASGASRILV
jgi:hypothetical protein